jgi:hypothetical protein
MDAQPRLAMTNVSGRAARKLTHPGGAIAAWLTLIGLYLASLMGPFSLPKSVENVLFADSTAAIHSPSAP